MLKLANLSTVIVITKINFHSCKMRMYYCCILQVLHYIYRINMIKVYMVSLFRIINSLTIVERLNVKNEIKKICVNLICISDNNLRRTNISGVNFLTWCRKLLSIKPILSVLRNTIGICICYFSCAITIFIWC